MNNNFLVILNIFPYEYKKRIFKMNRRPIFARKYDISKKMAQWLSLKKITPNQVSLTSVLFSLIAFCLMIGCSNGFFLSIIIVALLLCRLIANMMDGMVAIEYNKKSFDGALYNEIPDRVSDILTFIGMGFLSLSNLGLILGGLAASTSVLTACIRFFGGSLGFPQVYAGYGDKSKRIFVACLFLVLSGIFSNDFIVIGLLVITGLSIETCITRIMVIRQQMKENFNAE